MGNACCRKTGPDTQALKDSVKNADEPTTSKTKPNKYVKSTMKAGVDVNGSHENQGADVNDSQDNVGAGVNGSHECTGGDVNSKKTADYVNWDAIQEIQKEEEQKDSGEEEYVNIMSVKTAAKDEAIMPLRQQRSTRSQVYAPVSILKY